MNKKIVVGIRTDYNETIMKMLRLKRRMVRDYGGNAELNRFCF
jgi:hypothetical protein